jgi:phosphoglycerate dehydrogenase-like enzyme
MKVLFHYDCGSWLADRVAELAAEGLDVSHCSEADDAAFHALLPDAEVIWHVLRPIGAADLAAAPRLRLVQKIGVGVNTIDVEECRRRGIAVCNMPGTNARAVCELALALMLAVRRRVAGFDRALRTSGRWHWPADTVGSLGEIAGSRVGLVGFGAVPALLAPILTALGAEVAYTGRRPRPDVPYPFLSKEDLLATSDIVSLHVPLVAETDRWLDRASIARMKPGAILINTARGGLVDEAAIVEALRSGHLSGAGLDVFAVEPVQDTNPLLSIETVVATPHVAWLTRQTLERSLAVAAGNCRRLAAGEALLHRVA